jgi:glutathione peroxidase
MPESSLYDVQIQRLEGGSTTLGAQAAGKVALIVNTASRCGLTPQYEGLEALYRKYKDQGFVVLGFPSNQFGAQEPGSADEIASFCATKYDVSFPLFAKTDVNGPATHPLYQQLKNAQPGEQPSGDIKWNFAKFLVGRDGQVIARYEPRTAPDELATHIERALGPSK